MPHDLELVAELGAERADYRDVPAEVDQHHGERASREEIPSGARAAVDVGQRQPQRKREDGYEADRDDGSLAARQPGKRPGQRLFPAHGEQDPYGRVGGGDDETETGEYDDQVDDPQRRRRPVPAGEVPQRAGLGDEAGDAGPPCAERLRADDEQVENTGHDDDADDAGGNRPASVPGLLTERRGGLKSGEGTDAVDHRVGDAGE